MKLHMLIVSTLMAVLAFGCSKKETATASAPAPAAKAEKTSGARVIEITGNDKMQFNMTSINLKAGEEVQLKLTNIGSMPKQGMAHNIVVLKANADVDAFAIAAAPLGMKADNIPPAKADEVIAHTKMLGPKESDTITLKIDEPGTYAFICTFPGHFQLGMKGTITVK